MIGKPLVKSFPKTKKALTKSTLNKLALNLSHHRVVAKSELKTSVCLFFATVPRLAAAAAAAAVRATDLVRRHQPLSPSSST